ncbi:MAG: pseudouridylate synthase, partial [Crocinitomicaceae bacterium]|nr:pseudouridylate synthase [Crocinitomicaceae bacterium]
MLEVLFENEHIIAINKPHGLAVHKSKLVRNTTVFALQLLRDQIGHYVSPIHRIDRKTSGV